MDGKEQLTNGGPAFPQQCADALDVGMVHAGMSLRDWFAGMVLASAAALPMGSEDCASRAKRAYQQADAMLATRGER